MRGNKNMNLPKITREIMNETLPQTVKEAQDDAIKFCSKQPEVINNIVDICVKQGLSYQTVSTIMTGYAWAYRCLQLAIERKESKLDLAELYRMMEP